jgi:type IX secretion system PorP/SprF family membrane protein
MMKKSNCFLYLGLFFLSFHMKAQDFHLSQYDAAPMNLNPAMTGLFDGYYRIHGHYRTQWSAVSTKPFTTTNISYERPFKTVSGGAQIMNYRAGSGYFNVFSFLLSAGYDVTVDKNKLHHLSFGIEAGIIHTSVDMSRLTFGNQFISTADGGGFDTGLPTGESSTTTVNKVMPDVSAGMVYYYASNQSRINPFMGFSAFHLTQPDQSLLSATSKLPIRFNIHGGCKINLTEKIQILPKFLYMDQLNDKEFTMSVIGYYYLKSYDAFLLFGPTFRNKDAAIFEGGLKYGRYVYLMSYDINTSSLNPSTHGRGGLEFSVTYTPKAPKQGAAPTCPRL